MSYTVDLNAKPDDQMASLAKSQYDYYKQNYIPFENKMIANATGDMTPRINSVLSQLGTQQNNMAGIQARAASRYGMAQDPRTVSALNRIQGISNAAQSVAARNNLSQSLYDQNLSTLGLLTSIGRGLSSQAVDGMQGSMENRAARDAQYRTAMDSYRSAKAAYNSSPFTLFGLK